MNRTKQNLLYFFVIAFFIASAVLITQLDFKPKAFGKVSASVGVCVGQTPVLDSIGNLTPVAGSEFYFVVNSSSNGEAVVYATNSTIFTINETTGVINFTYGQVFSEWVRVSVNSSICVSLWDFEDVNLTVYSVSNPPVLDTIENSNLTEDVYFYYDVNASDPDEGDNLTFSDNTTMFDINSDTGVIGFTPTNDNVGVHWVTITVTDSNGFTDEQSVNFNVTNVNDAPVLNLIPNFTVESGSPLYEDLLFTYTVSATDPDGDTLQYIDNTTLFGINPDTGLIYFTPSASKVGNHSVEVYAVDGVASASQVFLMEILEVNDNPVMDYIGAQTAYINQSYYYDVNATDEEDGSDTDGNTNLTFSSDSSIFTINSTTGVIGFTPSDSQNGTYSITVSVNDTSGGSASELISFTVLAVNNPPSITSYSPTSDNVSIYVGDSQNFVITEEDVDGTVPSVYWYVDSSLSAQGIDSFKFNSTVVGTKNITVVVSDGEFDVAHEWSLTISEAPTTPAGGGAGGGGGGGGGGGCTEIWSCYDWSECMVTSIQFRKCEDNHECGTSWYKPKTQRVCVYTPTPTCFDFILNQNEVLVDCGGVCTPCPTCTDGICNQGELCQVCSGDGCPHDINGNVVPDCGGPCSPCVFPEPEVHEEVPYYFGWWNILVILLFLFLLVVLLVKLRRLASVIFAPEKEKSDERKVTLVLSLVSKAELCIDSNDVGSLRKVCSSIEGVYNSISSMEAKRAVYPEVRSLIARMNSKFG